MAQSHAPSGYLVRVITDDLEHQIWVAVTSRDEAVAKVLDCIPEGWTASLLGEESLDPDELATLKLELGDVRKLRE
jgi:hypothetical protein